MRPFFQCWRVLHELVTCRRSVRIITKQFHGQCARVHSLRLFYVLFTYLGWHHHPAEYYLGIATYFSSFPHVNRKHVQFSSKHRGCQDVWVYVFWGYVGCWRTYLTNARELWHPRAPNIANTIIFAYRVCIPSRTSVACFRCEFDRILLSPPALWHFYSRWENVDMRRMGARFFFMISYIYC